MKEECRARLLSSAVAAPLVVVVMVVVDAPGDGGGVFVGWK